VVRDASLKPIMTYPRDCVNACNIRGARKAKDCGISCMSYKGVLRGCGRG